MQLKSKLKSLWRSRVMELVLLQLKQGVTPEKIALTTGLGAALGVFPILGATTFLCLVTGVWLKLNQPFIQVVNWLMSPLQLPMILVFARIGEWITRATPVTFSVPELIRKFHESPGKFMQEFGMTGVHAIIAWALIAPIIVPLVYFLLLPAFKKLAGQRAAVPQHAE